MLSKFVWAWGFGRRVRIYDDVENRREGAVAAAPNIATIRAERANSPKPNTIHVSYRAIANLHSLSHLTKTTE